MPPLSLSFSFFLSNTVAFHYSLLQSLCFRVSPVPFSLWQRAIFSFLLHTFIRHSHFNSLLLRDLQMCWKSYWKQTIYDTVGWIEEMNIRSMFLLGLTFIILYSSTSDYFTIPSNRKKRFEWQNSGLFNTERKPLPIAWDDWSIDYVSIIPLHVNWRCGITHETRSRQPGLPDAHIQ